jgi:hypothetical protein
MIRRRYPVASGLAAEFVYWPGEVPRLEVQWDPEPPDALTGQARRRYREARVDFGLLVQRELGRPLVVVDTLGLRDEFVRDLELAIAPIGGRA